MAAGEGWVMSGGGQWKDMNVVMHSTSTTPLTECRMWAAARSLAPLARRREAQVYEKHRKCA